MDLNGEAEATVTLSDSFWRTCSELRSSELGTWLRRHGLAPWPHRQPPTLRIEPAGGNRFVMSP